MASAAHIIQLVPRMGPEARQIVAAPRPAVNHANQALFMSLATVVPRRRRSTRRRPATRREPAARLAKHHAVALLEAHAFAEQIGRPLNALVTIHWAKVDGGGDPHKRLARVLRRGLAWLRRRGHGLHHVWRREAGESVGDHVHLLLHIPAELILDFRQALDERWLEAGEEKRLDARDADDQAIYYLLKDLTQRDAEALGLPMRRWRDWRRQGRRSKRPMAGKTSGFSESLGPAARARWQAETPTAAPMPSRPAKAKIRLKPLPSTYGGAQKPQEAA